MEELRKRTLLQNSALARPTSQDPVFAKLWLAQVVLKLLAREECFVDHERERLILLHVFEAHVY